MLLVRDVDVILFDSNREGVLPIIEDELLCSMKYGCADDPMIQDRLRIRQEIVRGERFVDINGREVVIGLSQKVQEAIGLPFKVFDIMRKENEELKKHISALKIEKQKIVMDLDTMNINYAAMQNMSFWKRLKFLITKFYLKGK